MASQRKKVVIIGAGFGGLFAARTLAKKPVDVVLVDKNNFHTFTPLLYQVATSALDPSEIAYPVRNIFQKATNIRSLMGSVIDINYADKHVHIQTQLKEIVEPYDYLICATGSVPTYFGNEDFRKHALELRTLDDAIALRHSILTRFEQATLADDKTLRDALTTIVVVGGGPTGLETAGAIYELYNHVLRKEYVFEELGARVVLVEMNDNLLGPYPKKLQKAALKQLRSLGVEVILGNGVADTAVDSVTLEDGTIIHTYTLVWATGVKASPLGELLDVELKKNGAVPIQPTCEVIGREAIYAVGDMAYLEDKNGEPYPMLIPVAQQQGVLAAKNILAEIEGREKQQFEYNDRGIMATIGRRRAVAWIYNRIPLTGYLAWLAWLGLHLLTLLGFRNRLQVFINWMWNYITYDRSVRIILDNDPEPEKETAL